MIFPLVGNIFSSSLHLNDFTFIFRHWKPRWIVIAIMSSPLTVTICRDYSSCTSYIVVVRCAVPVMYIVAYLDHMCCIEIVEAHNSVCVVCVILLICCTANQSINPVRISEGTPFTFLPLPIPLFFSLSPILSSLSLPIPFYSVLFAKWVP